MQHCNRIAYKVIPELIRPALTRPTRQAPIRQLPSSAPSPQKFHRIALLTANIRIALVCHPPRLPFIHHVFHTSRNGHEPQRGHVRAGSPDGEDGAPKPFRRQPRSPALKTFSLTPVDARRDGKLRRQDRHGRRHGRRPRRHVRSLHVFCAYRPRPPRQHDLRTAKCDPNPPRCATTRPCRSLSPFPTPSRRPHRLQLQLQQQQAHPPPPAPPNPRLPPPQPQPSPPPPRPPPPPPPTTPPSPDKWSPRPRAPSP